ncbi:MAG: type II toxin-antitoxin system VapC family toxin [Acidobacteriia bacterium]|nr:type II toxin-antitoxin system VapC family toxin [Terriglobia bacterium]
MIDAAVVDASVSVKWVVRETGSDLARSLSSARLEAPDLLLVECANILWKKVRIGDLTRLDARGCLGVLLQAPVNLTAGRELLASAMDLSFELQHPIYDCLYLALAVRREIPLVTADERLTGAARKLRKFSTRVVLLAELAE